MAHHPAVFVFDCDGVLLDSNEMKTECFAQALHEAGCHPADIERFRTHQRANFGTSRHRLFETFLEWELQQRPPQDRDGLVALYAAALRGRYVTAPATPAMREVVGRLAAAHPVFIVSGSEQTELRKVLAERGDAGLFRLILGSPTGKAAHLQTLLELPELAGLSAADMLFVGDAEADFRAAQATGCRFIYMDHFSTAQTRMRALQQEHGFPMIQDLRGLTSVLTPA